MTTNAFSSNTYRYTVDQPLWLMCCKYIPCVFFSKKEKETQKTNSPTRSFHPTSAHPHYLQQYQAWFYVQIFFFIYSRFIREIVGEFNCNDKQSILEFSIHRRRIWKKEKQMKRIIMLLGLHLCKGIWFFVLEQNI